MWILVGAVVSASLLGSMHCVGMCGPLAIWASGAGESQRGSQMATATSLYHIGRMLTYMLAGFLAGAVGQLADLGGEALGVQLVAARIVGLLMIGIGAYRLWRMSGVQFNSGTEPPPVFNPGQASASPITKLLVRLRPYVFKLPIPMRGLATGLLTALLPCGWLYLFALVAAGTGSLWLGPVVMFAFWLGTVPALVSLVVGTQWMAKRTRRLVPVVTAVLLIFGGCFTATGRGFANLSSLGDIKSGVGDSSAGLLDSRVGLESDNRVLEEGAGQDAVDLAAQIRDLVKTPLPCCAEHGGTELGELSEMKASEAKVSKVAK